MLFAILFPISIYKLMGILITLLRKEIIMKNINIIFLLTLIIAFVAACDINDNTKDYPDGFIFNYDFKDGAEGWQSMFSDYPVGEENFYELNFAHTTLPAPLDENTKVIRISGNNHSDDLLSIIYRKFDELAPNTNYAVTFDLEIASNALKNGFGAGGSPDLSLGAGGLNFKPQNNVDSSDYYRPNFSSAIQSHESNDVLKVIGTIGVSEKIPTDYELINRDNLSDPFKIKSNDKGEVWLMIGTDSGFEATTTLYYKSIKIVLNEIQNFAD